MGYNVLDLMEIGITTKFYWNKEFVGLFEIEYVGLDDIECVGLDYLYHMVLE